MKFQIGHNVYCMDIFFWIPQKKERAILNAILNPIFSLWSKSVWVLRLLHHILISGIPASATQLYSHLIKQDFWTAAVMRVHLTQCFHFRVCIWAWAVMTVKPNAQRGVKQNTHQCLIQPSFVIAAVLMPQWWVGTH